MAKKSYKNSYVRSLFQGPNAEPQDYPNFLQDMMAYDNRSPYYQQMMIDTLEGRGPPPYYFDPMLIEARRPQRRQQQQQQRPPYQPPQEPNTWQGVRKMKIVGVPGLDSIETITPDGEAESLNINGRDMPIPRDRVIDVRKYYMDEPLPPRR